MRKRPSIPELPITTSRRGCSLCYVVSDGIGGLWTAIELAPVGLGTRRI